MAPYYLCFMVPISSLLRPLIFNCLFNSRTVKVTNCSSVIPHGIIAGEIDLIDWFDFPAPPPAEIEIWLLQKCKNTYFIKWYRIVHAKTNNANQSFLPPFPNPSTSPPLPSIFAAAMAARWPPPPKKCYRIVQCFLVSFEK